MKLPNYLPALLRHAQDTGIRKGKVHVLEVRHDDWCLIWKGRPCNCNPTVVSGKHIDRKYGLKP